MYNVPEELMIRYAVATLVLRERRVPGWQMPWADAFKHDLHEEILRRAGAHRKDPDFAYWLDNQTIQLINELSPDGEAIASADQSQLSRRR